MAAFSIVRGTTVGSAGTVSTGLSGSPSLATLGSPLIGNPTRVTVCVIAPAGATDVTFQVSYDNENWATAYILGTDTPAAMTLSSSGQALDITPAPYVQMTNGTSAKIFFYVYTS